jgi:hypothetical protein
LVAAESFDQRRLAGPRRARNGDNAAAPLGSLGQRVGQPGQMLAAFQKFRQFPVSSLSV